MYVPAWRIRDPLKQSQDIFYRVTGGSRRGYADDLLGG